MSKTLVIGTIAIVLLAFTLGGLFLWQMQTPSVPEQQPIQQTPPPLASPPQQQVLDTSTWQTYRNEEYGYEVKYPSDWDLPVPEQFRPQVDISNPFSSMLFRQEGLSEEETLSLLKKSAQVKIVVDYWTPLYLPSYLNLNRQVENLKKLNPKELKSKETVLDGAPGIRIDLTVGDSQREWIGKYVILNKDINLKIGKGIYSSAQYIIGGVFYSESDPDIFEQILSTFRFVE